MSEPCPLYFLASRFVRSGSGPFPLYYQEELGQASSLAMAADICRAWGAHGEPRRVGTRAWSMRDARDGAYIITASGKVDDWEPPAPASGEGEDG